MVVLAGASVGEHGRRNVIEEAAPFVVREHEQARAPTAATSRTRANASRTNCCAARGSPCGWSSVRLSPRNAGSTNVTLGSLPAAASVGEVRRSCGCSGFMRSPQSKIGGRSLS